LVRLAGHPAARQAVILKVMDWSTNLVVRARKEPPDKGGWNLLLTWFQATDISITLGITRLPEVLVEFAAIHFALHM
jgi:hypothetical protein